MSDATKLQVHLNEDGSVAVATHPAAGFDTYAVFRNVDIHDWRYSGGNADQAKWISREIDMHADDNPNDSECCPKCGGSGEWHGNLCGVCEGSGKRVTVAPDTVTEDQGDER